MRGHFAKELTAFGDKLAERNNILLITYIEEFQEVLHFADPDDTIKKAYFLLENLWESYMNSGKVNPVAGIFLGKNNYGYQDKTEYVLTPNQQNDNDYSADEIRERYIASDQQKRLSASNSDEDTSD